MPAPSPSPARRLGARVCALAVLMAVGVAGCASDGGKGSGPPLRDGRQVDDTAAEGRSELTRMVDGVKHVQLPPEPAACRGRPCLAVGARWSGRTPEMAILQLRRLGSAEPLLAARINVNGQVVPLQPLGPASALEGSPGSERSYTLAMAQLRRLAGASAAWVAVQTAQGWHEETLAEGRIDSPAYLGLRRFVGAADGVSMSLLP